MIARLRQPAGAPPPSATVPLPVPGRNYLAVNFGDRCVIPEIALYYDGLGQHLLLVFASLCEIILAQGLTLTGYRMRAQLADAHP
jgi:hypothetical protein